MKNISHLADALILVQKGEKLPLPDFTHQLCELQKVFQEPETRAFFYSARPLKRKKQILSQSLRGCVLYPVLLRFLYFLLDQNKFHHLDSIVKSFLKGSGVFQARLSVKVQVFCPLSSEEKNTLKRVLEQAFRKKVSLRESVNPHTLGGLRMEMEGQVWDHTLQYHLKQMETQIRSRLYDYTGG